MTAVREWATFPDPRRRHHVWHVDVTFLTSHWRCLYGQGCPGVLTEPAPELEHGCCSYGAHAASKLDRHRVTRAAAALDRTVWQHKARADRKGIWVKTGDGWRTRLVDGACIFLNRPGFRTGAGCALHQQAVRTGTSPDRWKPEVCWQLPLRDVQFHDDDADDGIVHHRLTEFGRHGWGEGGRDFAWWCTEAPEAFTGHLPVYRSLETELRRMLGDELYQIVAAYLDERVGASGPPVPHPAEIPVTVTPTRRRAMRSA
jgi:hypothetical protein